MVISDVDILQELLHVNILLTTKGCCSSRELYTMVTSRIVDDLSFTCFTVLIPLLEHALKELPTTFWLTGNLDARKNACGSWSYYPMCRLQGTYLCREPHE
jgi:hypothetical protein